MPASPSYDATAATPDAAPLVSVLVPSYNHARYLEETVESCLAQDYPNVEVVIVDDVSTDETPEVLARLRERTLPTGRRLVIVQKTVNGGLNATIADCFAHSTGAFIQVLASDDRIAPDKFSRQMAVMQAERADAVYATCRYLDEHSRPGPTLNLDRFEAQLRAGTAYEFACTHDYGLPLLQSALLRRDVHEKMDARRKGFKSDDWVVLIELLRAYKVGFVNAPLVEYRQHTGNSFQQTFVTLPMQVDVISRTIPQQWQGKALSRVFATHGQRLLTRGHAALGLRFLAASQVFALTPRAIAIAMYLLLPAPMRRRLKRLLGRGDGSQNPEAPRIA